MIKNIYKPDNEDILFWLAHNEKWPKNDLGNLNSIIDFVKNELINN